MRNTYYLLFCIILLWCRPTPGSWALCILDKEWSTAGLYKLRLNPTLVISPDFTLSAGAWRCHPFITLLRCVTPTHQGSKLGGRQLWALTLSRLIGLDLPCTYLCRSMKLNQSKLIGLGFHESRMIFAFRGPLPSHGKSYYLSLFWADPSLHTESHTTSLWFSGIFVTIFNHGGSPLPHILRCTQPGSTDIACFGQTCQERPCWCLSCGPSVACVALCLVRQLSSDCNSNSFRQILEVTESGAPGAAWF